MKDTLYDNPAHWKAMHVSHGGSLKAVGRSGLSDTYNVYKYRSEEAVFSKAIRSMVFGNKKGSPSFSVLDIGAGTGYWMHVVKQLAAEVSLPAALTAIDLSEHALALLKKNIPEATCLLQNAGSADPLMLASHFDLVMANYCLHHITKTNQFLNALQLAVNSVKPGGYLLLMDCLIDRKYSPYYNVHAETYTGSGLSRPLRLVDDVCEGNNMRRVYMAEPISFLMNNVLEADSKSGYLIRQFLWKAAHRFYKSERASRWLMPVVFRIDRFLTTQNKGYSTRLVIYQKQGI